MGDGRHPDNQRRNGTAVHQLSERRQEILQSRSHRHDHRGVRGTYDFARFDCTKLPGIVISHNSSNN